MLEMGVPGVSDAQLLEQLCLIPHVIVQLVIQFKRTQPDCIVHCRERKMYTQMQTRCNQDTL